MPRVARRKSISGIYHVILRGINKQTIFEDDEDKGRFLETLKKYKELCNYQLYSYCLMDNHIHLLMRESDESISNVIKRISSSYVYWYNLKYDRCGHLFQERFKSENVETKTYFMNVLRYIHQNPLKAGLTRNVFESKWTSLNEYFGNINIVDTDLGLKQFSPDKETAITLFNHFMTEHNEDQCLEYKIIARKSDDEVREELEKLGIPSTSVLQALERKSRDEALGRLKELSGISVRQLSRITGISRSVIQRIQ
ncbi:transposase [Bacillus sp. DJP31]|uniref:transposase n=1 Tax=Bacillus sp. DJP31 TaxID=3409789 RepID=UPI003BB63260